MLGGEGATAALDEAFSPLGLCSVCSLPQFDKASVLGIWRTAPSSWQGIPLHIRQISGGEPSKATVW